MSGAGRKHRAKHLTRQYLDASGWVGPGDGETLAICLESPHGQHVRVLLLFAHPEYVAKTERSNATPSATASDIPTATAAIAGQASSSETNTERREAEKQVDEAPETLLEKEQLAFLPGKFHKVIWLRIKDIVVVSDGTVTFKPSPEQVENFLRDPRNAGWRERIAAAQQKAEVERVAVQRMPLYSSAAQTTTSVLTGPQVQQAEQADNGNAEDVGEDAEDLVNPNWRNIKHQQQFFYGMDDTEDDEEEDEEEESEENL